MFKLLIKYTLIAGGLVVLFMIFKPVQACSDHVMTVPKNGQLSLYLGIGKQGMWIKPDNNEWLGENDIAFVGRLAYMRPLYSDWLLWNSEIQHSSNVNRGWPVDDRSEDELDQVTTGLLFLIY